MIVEHQISISTKDLKGMKLLQRIGKRSKGIRIYRNNIITNNKEEVASFQIIVNIEKENDYVVLEYEYNGQEITDKIQLEAIKSNLGERWVYFFICPNTGKKCRKLYLHNGYFRSRQGIGGMLYQQQAISTNNRNIFRLGRDYNRFRQLQLERFKPHFRATYEGIRTRRVRKMERAAVKLGKVNRQL